MSKKFLYREIIEYLEQLIEKNKMIIKYRMPSENQLAAKFNVSRITAKNAINNLVESGKLFRRQGKGTFIVNPNFDNKYNSNLDNRASIGLLLPNVESAYVTKIIEGVSSYLDKVGMPLIVFYSNNNQDTESFLLAHARTIGVVGLIVVSVESELYNKGLLRLALSGFPMVFLDKNISGIDALSVTSAHRQSGFDALNYLTERGHRYIGFIKDTDSDIDSLEQRYKGYEQALIAGKMSIRPDHVLTLGSSDDNVITQISGFLKAAKYMTAVIVSCKNSNIPYLFEAIEKNNIRVPQDLSVIVYDNDWEAYKNFLPFVPHYIKQFPKNIGKTAAKIVIDIISKRPPAIRIYTVECELVEGTSVLDIRH